MWGARSALRGEARRGRARLVTPVRPPSARTDRDSPRAARHAILPRAMPRLPSTTDAQALRDLVVRLAAAAVRAPVVVGVTALGAGVVVCRELLRLVSSLLPSWGAAPSPRHHAGRVRERARAAEQAARASGLLSPRDR